MAIGSRPKLLIHRIRGAIEGSEGLYWEVINDRDLLLLLSCRRGGAQRD